ncbi:MAG: dihydroorotase family protein [Patescibacteria group bacterium]
MKERILFRIPEVIPNMHCHSRGFRERYKTTIFQMLAEAQKSLISIMAFMPNTNPPIINFPMLEAVLKLIVRAKEKLGIIHDQYVWFGVTDNNLGMCKIALIHPLVIGLKVYPKALGGKTVTTGKIGVMDRITILVAMEIARNANKPIAFHCDDPDIIAKTGGHPIEAEIEYVKKILHLAKLVPGVKIIICHVSCRESAELILRAQAEGMQVVIELCPHYLWFDSAGTNWKPGLSPAFYKCFNNLRGPEHREFLVSLLKTDNPLIIISTDDAWHAKEEKLSLNPPGGIPSIREMVPLIVTFAVQHKISEQRVAELISFNPSKVFGIEIFREMIGYEWEEREDDILYNGGKVVNPWNGSRLYFPVI